MLLRPKVGPRVVYEGAFSIMRIANGNEVLKLRDHVDSNADSI